MARARLTTTDPIGQRIAEACDLIGNRSEAAAAIGTQPKHLRRLITGEVRPGLVMLERIAELSGVSLDWIVRGTCAPPRRPPATVSDLHSRLLGVAKFLALEPGVVLTAWDQDSGSDWIDVWRGLPDYVRQAAMAAVYLWGHPLEEACRAAHAAWAERDDEERRKAGELPVTWCSLIAPHLPRRPGSGTMPSPAVGNLGGSRL